MVVAEGIEDFQEALKLKALGCGMGQGYFYGRPADGESTRGYISERYVDRLQGELAPMPVSA